MKKPSLMMMWVCGVPMWRHGRVEVVPRPIRPSRTELRRRNCPTLQWKASPARLQRVPETGIDEMAGDGSP